MEGLAAPGHAVGLAEIRRLAAVSSGTDAAFVCLEELVENGSRSGLLIVDNVHSLMDDAAAWLAGTALADARPSPRLVVSGRHLPPPLAAMEFEGAATRLDTDDLRLSQDEAQTLVEIELGARDADRLGGVLHEFSEGWVALLVLVSRRLRRTADRVGAAADLVRHRALVGQLVDHYLGELPPEDRALVVQLAHFPMVNENIVGALGSQGVLRRLRETGMPFAIGADGWWRMPSPVQQHVAAQAPLEGEVATRAAPLLVAQGAELDAAELLADSGCHRTAARLLALLPTRRIDSLDAERFVRLVNRLGAAAESAPRVLLHLARAHGILGHRAQERAAIDRAQALIHGLPPESEIALEIEAELVFQRAVANEAGVVTEVEHLLESTPPNTRAHARLLEALGVGLAERCDEGSLRRAEIAMREASVIWRELGEPSRWAAVQRSLAVRVMAALGRAHDAVVLLGSLREVSGTPYDRMMSLVFEARMRALAGEGWRAEEVLAEATSLADLLRIDWVTGHAAWTRLIIAANEQGRVRVVEQLNLAEPGLGQLVQGAGGLRFLCEAAEACAVVGAHGPMERLMATASARRSENAEVYELTEAGLAARLGRSDAAGRLCQLCEEGRVPPGSRWKVALLRAHAEVAGGNLRLVRQLLHDALASAAFLGEPDVLERREGRIFEAVRGAIAAHDATTTESDSLEEFEIRVLGRFEVRRDGIRLPAAPGRAAELVKRVVMADGSVAVEALVEDMWPHAAPGVGQRRLRNVLARSRATFGPLLARNGRYLQLGSCRVDLFEFQRLATAAAASGGADRVVNARDALRHYSGPLLSDDVYDDRIARRREAVRRRAVGLMDLVLDADLASGDLDDATRVAELAARHDPSDQQRPLHVARALLTAGRYLEARSLSAQVLAHAGELDLPAAEEWREMLEA